jgi:hypothetical protein
MNIQQQQPKRKNIDLDERLHKIFRFHEELPSSDAIARVNNAELSELYQSVKNAIEHGEMLCKHYDEDCQHFFKTQQFHEAQAAQLKAYIEVLKINQNREFYGFSNRIQTRIREFQQIYKEAQEGAAIIKSGEFVFQPPIYAANDALNLPELDWNIEELNESQFELPPLLLPTTTDADMPDFKFNNIESISQFIPPKTSDFIDANEFKTKIVPLYPLRLPLRIQALTIDQTHLMECLLLSNNNNTDEFIVQLVFAGKYRQPVMFSSLSEAWLQGSRMCSENPNMKLPSHPSALNAFRLCDDEYAHIPYSLQYLITLYKRFEDSVKRGTLKLQLSSLFSTTAADST